MTTTDYERITRHVLDAWNSHDVERLVACYTPDLVYRDPNTRGEVHGADAFRAYLTKLFGSWRMHWTARQLLPLAGTDGVAALWQATLRPVGTDRAIEIEGVDVVVLAGELVQRNEVYFDRAALLPLLAA
jgi:ketosteroid isomerase-like protein